MDEDQILTFLKKLIHECESGKVTEEQKKVVSEFFMEFNFVEHKDENLCGDLIK